MRTWRESIILAAFFALAVLAMAWRIGYNMGADVTPVPAQDPCNGENLSYRADTVAIRTYVGDPGNGVLCAVVPLALVVTE